MRGAALFSASVSFLLSGCADLVTTNVGYRQFTGGMYQVNATVKNQGSQTAPASTTRLDVKPAGATTFTRSVETPTPALAPGQEIELFMGVLYPIAEVPVQGSGQCVELRACADSGDVVDETSFGEGNNCRVNTTCR
jgi:hypothetical protein